MKVSKTITDRYENRFINIPVVIYVDNDVENDFIKV